MKVVIDPGFRMKGVVLQQMTNHKQEWVYWQCSSSDMIGNIKEVKHVMQTKGNTAAAESEQKCEWLY